MRLEINFVSLRIETLKLKAYEIYFTSVRNHGLRNGFLLVNLAILLVDNALRHGRIVVLDDIVYHLRPRIYHFCFRIYRRDAFYADVCVDGK